MKANVIIRQQRGKHRRLHESMPVSKEAGNRSHCGLLSHSLGGREVSGYSIRELLWVMVWFQALEKNKGKIKQPVCQPAWVSATPHSTGLQDKVKLAWNPVRHLQRKSSYLHLSISQSPPSPTLTWNLMELSLDLLADDFIFCIKFSKHPIRKFTQW